LVALFLLVACTSNAPANLARAHSIVRQVFSEPQVYPAPGFVPSPLPLPPPDPLKKADVVVFVTRPGDEVLATMGVILQATESGKRAVVVFLTNGEANPAAAAALAGDRPGSTPTPKDYLRLAAILQEQALRVGEEALRLKPGDVIFLGYPDGVLSEFSPEVPDKVIKSPYTEKDGLHDPNVTPWRITKSGQAFPYTFNAIIRDLNDLLVELEPKEIYLPAPWDQDPTRVAAARLVERSLAEVLPSAEISRYVIEGGPRAMWPNPPRIRERATPGEPFLQVADQGRTYPLGAPWPPDRRVPLAVPERKQKAIALYTALVAVDREGFYAAFVKREEIFWSKKL